MSGIATAIIVGSEALTLVISTLISVFIAGIKWGNIEATVNLMSDRLAKIEGMFVLRIKDNDHENRLPMGLVRVDYLVFVLGILGNRHSSNQSNIVGLCLATRRD